MRRRAILGALFLMVVATALVQLVGRSEGTTTLARRLLDHLRGDQPEMEVSFSEPIVLRAGDPVFTIEGEAFARQGTVLAVDHAAGRIRIAIDPMVLRQATTSLEAVAMTPKGNLGWMVRTLAPPEMRTRIADDLLEIWEAERERTVASLSPLLLDLLGDLTAILADTFPEVLLRHRELVDGTLAVLEEEIYEVELAPVLEDRVLSRLEKRLTPTAARLGQAIWEEVSTGDLVGLLWTATRGSVGLGSDEEMAQELARILEAKALPVIRARGSEMLVEATAALTEAARDEKVREAVDRAAMATASHPRFQELVATIARSWIVENQRLRKHLVDALGAEAFRRPIDRLLIAAEPRLREALEEMLTREDRAGMDHRLVRVLRRMVLFKDLRYVLLVEGPAGSSPPTAGGHLEGRRGHDR